MMRIIVLGNDDIETIKNGKVVVVYQTDSTELNIMSEQTFERLAKEDDEQI